MQIADVYKLLLDALRADSRGLSVEVDEFNRYIRLVNQEVFDEYLKDFETEQGVSDDLAFLKVHDFQITLTALPSRSLAYGSMPSNYYQVIGKPWTATGVYVDEVTEFEDGVREGDFLTKASTTYPTCRIGGVNGTGDVQIKVRPQTITSVYVSYLREVTVPYLDYYVTDATGVITYLPDTSTPQSLPSGTTHSSGTVGGAGVTITSLTVDLEWGEGDLALILARLMAKVGSALPDEGIQQSALVDEQKIQAE